MAAVTAALPASGSPAATGCAQLGDALINGLIAALDQAVGVQAQHRAGLEVQGAYLAALLAGHADGQIGGLRRLMQQAGPGRR